MKPVNLKTTMKLYEANRDAQTEAHRAFRELVAETRTDGQKTYLERQHEAKAAKAKAAEETLKADPIYVKIAAELATVQKRCSVRTIRVEDILYCLRSVEAELGIPKAAMNEVSVIIDLHEQNFPSAYKGIPESTKFQALYRNGSWRITDIWRAQTARYGHGVSVCHTESSKKALLDRYTTFHL